MKRTVLLWLTIAAGSAQSLPVKWEELTAADFQKAIEKAQQTCVLPFGIIEKHGPTGPIGTDLMNVRYATFEAVRQEYAIVFPEYYFGQIFEAKHQPGTIAYSTHLQWNFYRRRPMNWRATAARPTTTRRTSSRGRPRPSAR